MRPLIAGTHRATHGDVREPQSAQELNRFTSAIIAAAIRVHRTLGPGLLEHAYVACLAYELTSSALHIETETIKRVVNGFPEEAPGP